MKKWMYNALLIFFALVFVGSSGMLVYYVLDGNAQESTYSDLSALHADSAGTLPVPGGNGPTIVETPTDDSPWVTVVDPDTGENVQLLPEFLQLYGLNNDLVGWITVPGTKIDYPVMQTPDVEDYYLRRDFYEKKASAGSIYVEEFCDVFIPTDNVTIYGHMMRNGSMFADLAGYKKQSFWEEHKIIEFNTLREHHTYEVFAVFLTTASVGKGFTYHSFDMAEDQKEFDTYVAKCKKISLYDTGITPQYGDKLITLSTCEYSQTNGRLVVVASRID